MSPRIVVTNGPNRGLAIEVGAAPITVGHHESRDLPLKDDRISRLHARIERQGQEVVLTDLGSTNGTFINGALTKTAILQPGDIIVMGKTCMQFELETATVITARPAEPRSLTSVSPISQDTTALLADTVALDNGTLATQLLGSLSAPGPTCDAALIAREAVAGAQSLARQRRVTLSFTSPPELHAQTHAGLLYRLLTTLLFACLEGAGKEPTATTLRLTAQPAERSEIQISLACANPKGMRQAMKEVIKAGLLEADVAALQSRGGSLALSEDDSPGEDIFTIVLRAGKGT
jgi:pSer/pThr/pTyr-binding forkhead associated (FHA) protein